MCTYIKANHHEPASLDTCDSVLMKAEQLVRERLNLNATEEWNEEADAALAAAIEDATQIVHPGGEEDE